MSNVKRVQIIGANIYFLVTDTTARAGAQAALEVAQAAKALTEPQTAVRMAARSKKARKAAAPAIEEPIEAVIYEEPPETFEEQLANVEVNLTMAAKAVKEWKANN